MQPSDVAMFWIKAGPKAWFKKSKAFDAEIRGRFEALHHAAARGELDGWAQTADGALALLLLLDQFPRNLFRGSPHAFATDPLARKTARKAVERGFDRQVDPELRQFFYLPFEHSEHLADQDRGVALCAASGDAELLKWATLHRDIIARFGRFPHRNACLARETTDDERAFLNSGGFAG
jgi:uncharacterized protein (DUF924 family)